MRLLARTGIDHSLQEKADPSDLVQDALLKAHRHFEQFQGRTEAELHVHDADGGAPAGLHARVPRPVPSATMATATPSLNQNVGLMAWDAAVADLFPTGLARTQRKRT